MYILVTCVLSDLWWDGKYTCYSTLVTLSYSTLVSPTVTLTWLKTTDYRQVYGETAYRKGKHCQTICVYINILS